MKITLTNGKTVQVKSFHFTATYGNLLEGSINEKTNTLVFNSLEYPENWGNRKLLKIKPKSFQQKLPSVCFSVWLHSHQPIRSDYDGSELVIIWLGEIEEETRITEIIKNIITPLNWENNAQDYLYDI